MRHIFVERLSGVLKRVQFILKWVMILSFFGDLKMSMLKQPGPYIWSFNSAKLIQFMEHEIFLFI